MNKINFRFLNGNMLKIIGAIFMVVDHVGVLFFPGESIFRILGRIAYPIFAFMIAEGARYTRNKIRYLLTIGGLALICQLAYFIFANDLYMCILVTFTLSIITIYAVQYLKKAIFSTESRSFKTLIPPIFLTIFTIFTVYYLNQVLVIDYGFVGCMVPVIVSLFDFKDINLPEKFKWLDSHYRKVGALAMALLWLAYSRNSMQLYMLMAIPILLLYSEKRGSSKLKYFFYIFYPVHLVVLEGIYIVLRYL